MTTTEDVTASGERTVELYVRALAPRAGSGRVDRVRADLDRLADEGAVTDYSVTIWGDALPVDGDHALVDRVAAFRSWAAETGATLVGVEERPAGSLVDEKRQVTSLPTIALAEYRDGELAAVTPHERDGALRTVADHVGALALDSNPRGERERAASD